MDQADFQALAHQFISRTLQVKPGHNVWVNYRGAKALILAQACAEEILRNGAKPFMVDRGSAVLNSEVASMSAMDIAAYGEKMLAHTQRMQAFIAVRDEADQQKVTLSEEKRKLLMAAERPMLNYRVNKMPWLIVDAPTEEFAAACGMPFAEFENFYRDVCLVDYNLMTGAVSPLKKMMTEGKKVRILSPAQDTDLNFSIEGIPACASTGKLNIPDGECYTAPVKNSISGQITFVASCFDGQRFERIKLKFKDGRIIEAEAENAERTEALNKILDRDDGARYIGEFAISFNPYVQHPTGSILFDEKINGGLHLAAGNAYVQTDNGNKSAIHWDMVHIQRPEYGGGEIWIDDVLIRKNGIFVVPELYPLNPDKLRAATLGQGARKDEQLRL